MSSSTQPTLPSAVHVYVWESAYRPKSIVHGRITYGRYTPCNIATALWYGTEGSVGHVSLQMGTQYVSLWPDDTQTMFNFSKPQRRNMMPNLATDKKYERRDPRCFTLYSLNLDKMKTEYQKFNDSKPRYHITGRHCLCRCFRGNSCSGLAYDLLIAGGIIDMSEDFNICRLWCIITPNNLIPLLEDAVNYETRKQ